MFWVKISYENVELETAGNQELVDPMPMTYAHCSFLRRMKHSKV
jgi:hypothetical protein